MTIDQSQLDAVREQVLDRMERRQKMARQLVICGAVFEACLIFAALLLFRWNDRELMILLFLLNYMLLTTFLMALAGHLTRSTARILAALEASAR
jgi:hypothetical protein